MEFRIRSKMMVIISQTNDGGVPEYISELLCPYSLEASHIHYPVPVLSLSLNLE